MSKVDRRNLHPYRGSLWYERVVRGRRYRADTETTDWKEAAEWRDAYEAAKGIGRRVFYTGAVPTFADMAARYLEEDTAHLATTTRADRKGHLGEKGAILPHLGRKRLDDISAATLREWWNAEIQGTERTTTTGRRYSTPSRACSPTAWSWATWLSPPSMPSASSSRAARARSKAARRPSRMPSRSRRRRRSKGW